MTSICSVVDLEDIVCGNFSILLSPFIIEVKSHLPKSVAILTS